MEDPQSWEAVKSLQDWFQNLNRHFPVISFYETKQTTWRGSWKKKKAEVLCDEQSVRLSFNENGETIPVDMDHIQLSSFPARTDQFQDRILQAVHELITRLPPEPAEPILQHVTTSDPSIHPSITKSSIAPSNSLEVISVDESAQEPPILAGLQNLYVALGNTPCYMIDDHPENPGFVGRSETLTTIQKALDPSNGQSTYALSGLGGVGKTQTALKFAYQCKEMGEYRAILWAAADSRPKLAQSYYAFAVKLGLVRSDSSDHNGAKESLKKWFEQTHEQWLIVFDNADTEDNLALIDEFRPDCASGSILITSRDKHLTTKFGGREIGNLSENEAVKMIWNLTNRSETMSQNSPLYEQEHAAAKAIARKLGYYPLAITTASSVIMNELCTLSEFEEEFSVRDMIEESAEITMANRLGKGYNHSLLTVWDMNFQRLKMHETSLLYLFAFLDPDNIPDTLLSKGAVKSSDPELEFLNNKKYVRCRRPILQSSFVTGEGDLRMHRVVRTLCHMKMGTDERQQAFTRAVLVVKNAWPIPERHYRHRPDLWPEQSKYLRHVQSLSDFYRDSCSTDDDENLVAGREFADLLYQASWFLYERGLFEQAYPLLDIAQSCCLSLQNVEQILADIHGCRASLHTETNAFPEAYSEFKLQFDYTTTAFANGLLLRPNVRDALSYGGLANGLQGLKRYPEAEKEYRTCIHIWESCPGTPVIYQSNLATCLWLQHKLEEAETILDNIIIDQNDITSFRTGLAMYTLGNIQISQAYDFQADGREQESNIKFDQAYATHNQTLDLFLKTLKDKHHKTADAYHKVAWHLHRRQDYANAEKMLETALGIYRLSKSNFYRNEIARTTYKLGCVLFDSGNTIRGRQTQLEAKELRREILGSDCSPAKSEDDYDDLVMFWSR